MPLLLLIFIFFFADAMLFSLYAAAADTLSIIYFDILPQSRRHAYAMPLLRYAMIYFFAMPI